MMIRVILKEFCLTLNGQALLNRKVKSLIYNHTMMALNYNSGDRKKGTGKVERNKELSLWFDCIDKIFRNTKSSIITQERHYYLE